MRSKLIHTVGLMIFILTMMSGCGSVTNTLQTTTPVAPSPQYSNGTGIQGYATSRARIGAGAGDYTDPVPLLDAILVLDSENNIVARVQPGEGGYFQVELSPGTYFLSIDPASYASRWAGMYTVAVTKGKMSDVDITVTIPLT